MELHKLPFIVALVAGALCFLVEVGAPVVLPRKAPDRAELQAHLREEGLEDQVELNDVVAVQREHPPTPGRGIPSLAVLDGLLLLTLALMAVSLLLPGRVHGRIQGLITLVGALVALLAGLVLLVATLNLLLLMVALFTSPPFGTLAYLAVWGFFNRSGAAATLGLLLLLKLILGGGLLLAHPRFLQNKGLVLLVLTSLLANALISFLHGLVPLLLVSITDAIAALVVLVLALVWTTVLLVGALVSLFRLLKLPRLPLTSGARAGAR